MKAVVEVGYELGSCLWFCRRSRCEGSSFSESFTRQGSAIELWELRGPKDLIFEWGGKMNLIERNMLTQHCSAF
jgi:hypothetical protein